MEKAYLFLRKLVSLGLIVLIFIIATPYIPLYISLPVLLIIFSLMVSRITNSVPKELFNYQRSEKYFAQGGLRDLLRIPVVLFAFVHDVVVWQIWGIYQTLLLLTDAIYFIKEIIFGILHAIIWFLKLLLPFWRIAYQMFVFYCIKWPWWIYRYSFKAVKRAYNWNMLKVSTIGAFIALLLFQLFFFLDISLDISGLVYIGIILALLPISWVFGEIASIRGQNLMFEPFSKVRFKMRNGLESVRGLLFFITFFVVVLLAEAGLSLLGWIPQSGVILLGISLNISYILNLLLIFLSILIVFGTFILPSYRLYNEFNETSFRNIYSLFTHIVKRSLQYIVGFIPSSLFAGISIVPAALLIAFTLALTLQIKENTTDIKIQKLLNQQSNAKTQFEDYRIGKEIDRMEYIAVFPMQFLQEVNHKSLLKEELNDYIKQEKQYKLDLAQFQSQTNNQIKQLVTAIDNEQKKPVINQTRVEDLQQNKTITEKRYKEFEAKLNTEIEILKIDIDYAKRKYKQAPLLFYLSGFFIAIALTLIFAFILSYYGNFFYRAFLFRNDKGSAEWKNFIQNEQKENKHQPLLSTSLNILVFLVVMLIIYQHEISSFFIF